MALYKSDLSLIELLRSDDEKAFDKLFLKYYVSLCRFVFIYVKDQFASEEIVQELFINLWEQRKKITITTSFTSYLYTAAKNRSLNYLQKGKTRKLHENLTANEKISEVYVMDDMVTFNEIHLELSKAIEKLPQKCRQIFHLSRTENLSNAEIAKQLGISVKTVENQITIALKKIKTYLSPYLGFILFLF